MVLGTIDQIQFYWDAGMFSSTSSALAVCEEFRLLLEYVQHICMTGRKSDDVEHPTIQGAKIDLYYCEIEIEKVFVLVKVGDLKRVYMGQLTLGSMYTENQDYYQETEEWLNATIKKSNLISEVSQTTRHQVSKKFFKNLVQLETKIKSDL